MTPEKPPVLSQAVKDDLIAEKSLWDIWLASLSIPFGRFNLTMLGVAIGLLVLDSATSDAHQLLEMVRGFSRDGLALGISVIALLLSGFAVFATVSQPNLLLSMAITKHDCGLSYLKYNFFVFMRVFCLLIVFSATCAVLVVSARDDGAGYHFVQWIGGGVRMRELLIRTAFVVLFSGYVVVLLEIKSFVFNIYHSVMTSLRWRADGGQ